MNIQHQFSLKNHNTFGIDAKASSFVSVQTIEELQQTLSTNKDIFVLGGGSNILLTKDINKLVIHLNLKGKEVVSEDSEAVYVKAQGGENWHDFVLWCIDNDYGGLENLSLIPGNVGTSPIQNIGAYGVELKDTFHKLKAIEIATGKRRVFTKEECNFGYRNSIFKNELKGKYIITSVIFKLTKNNHKLHCDYGAIKDELEAENIKTPTIKDVSNAVITIRKSKLPDPAKIGNSGSFFKNPIIATSDFNQLKLKHPNIPSYKVSETETKVPAGWLIEQAGFKGKRFGDAGIHTKQALVLVNYGEATGKEVYEIAHQIQEKIKENYNISLEIEVNII